MNDSVTNCREGERWLGTFEDKDIMTMGLRGKIECTQVKLPLVIISLGKIYMLFAVTFSCGIISMGWIERMSPN
jgi:hypothetical protein